MKCLLLEGLVYKKKMIKLTLVHIASQHLKDPLKLVNTLFKEMNLALLRGEIINIRNFGKFTLRHIKKNSGYNFKEKHPIKISKWTVAFKVSKNMEKLFVVNHQTHILKLIKLMGTGLKDPMKMVKI